MGEKHICGRPDGKWGEEVGWVHGLYYSRWYETITQELQS
jgi:hypothetical protein